MLGHPLLWSPVAFAGSNPPMVRMVSELGYHAFFPPCATRLDCTIHASLASSHTLKQNKNLGELAKPTEHPQKLSYVAMLQKRPSRKGMVCASARSSSPTRPHPPLSSSTSM